MPGKVENRHQTIINIKIKFQAKLEKAEAIEDCEASKECDKSQVLLRVKDPLAALYPFVGIVAEVRGDYHYTDGFVCLHR